MKSAVIILACAACNPLLGLDDVAPRDAPIDASIQCPRLGEAPAYLPAIVQHVAAQACRNYQVDRAGDLAIMMCSEAELCDERAYEGPVTGPFVPALDATFGDVRIDPDGMELYAYDNVHMKLAILRRVGSTWVPNELVVTGLSFPQPSNVARVGDAVHVILTELGGGPLTFHEWVGVAGTWSEQDSYTSDMLGTVKGGSTLDLSPDGLRLVVETGTPGDLRGTMVYLDRASVTDRFGPPIPLQLTDVADPFISEDCTRVYFSGLDRIFYAQRQ